MYFYHVWVRSNRYHGSEALTYSSEKRLDVGSIIRVELQKNLVMGLVTAIVTEPRFRTKPITYSYDLPPIPLHLVNLAEWLRTYYPAPIGIVTQQLLPAGLSEKSLLVAPPPKQPEPNTSKLPPLSPDQTAAIAAMQSRDTYVVHGQTGSGKTRLYMELALQTVNKGKSAIILTPEISLTSQLARNFRVVFGDSVIVLHSQQTPNQRQAAWLQSLKATGPVIIIGPRSALFTPVKKLGLIVLDEAHEAAYKQEQAPQYQTGRVAAYLAKLAQATLVLGSATPAVTDYYLAEQKHKSIIKLTSLANAESVSKISVIDLKDRSLFTRSNHLSQPLIKAMEQALSRGQQSLLYLNRRGTARLVMCENCGWQADCPHCSLPLAYHGDDHQLRCHSCSYHAQSPTNCPVCGHPSILFTTAGTKAIVEEVAKLFPQARVGRFDTDNTKAERFEQHFEAVSRGEIDILVGTQLLAKGLDLPKLSTLGVILADTSLYLPDFSAQERTFQLICQVIGRIGRGHVSGDGFIQTYHPDHPLLKAALEQDYQGFYETELATRKMYLFPPFCYLLKLSCRRASIKSAEAAAETLKSTLQTSGLAIRVEGPAPAFHEHFQGKYQWQLVVKATDRNLLLKVITLLPKSGWSYDIDPINLL